MVRRKSYYDKDSKIIITVDGKKVDLEDAFEVFEDLFDDIDLAFDKMAVAFKNADENIWSKLDTLKRRIAEKRPHEFEYVDTNDEPSYETYDNETRMKYEAIRISQNHILKMMLVLVAVTLIFSLAAYLLISPTPKNDMTPTPKIEEKLDSL